MRVVGDGLESGAVCSGRKTIHGRDVTAVFVKAELRILRVSFWARIRNEPLHIHHRILPPCRLQVLSQPFRVRLELRFIDGGAVGIPAIPAHWRSGGNQGLVNRWRSRLSECVQRYDWQAEQA